jgi:hypothetical protein
MQISISSFRHNYYTGCKKRLVFEIQIIRILSNYLARKTARNHLATLETNDFLLQGHFLRHIIKFVQFTSIGLLQGVPKSDLYRNQLFCLKTCVYAFENIIEWLMNDRSIFITARAFVAVRQKLISRGAINRD